MTVIDNIPSPRLENIAKYHILTCPLRVALEALRVLLTFIWLALFGIHVHLSARS